MYVNFAEACFLWSGSRYEHAPNLSDCLAQGDDVHPYQDEQTRSLADQCSTLNTLSRIQPDNSYTFAKLMLHLDGKAIASAREACAQFVRVFADKPFDVYEKTVKSCRTKVGLAEDCVMLLGTSAGVLVGFFFYEQATDTQSQCETLKAAQAQPPNLVCTFPSERIGPDLRFRPSTDLSQCPPLPPPSVSPACSDTGKP
jgi:hypothetical protein